MQGSCFIFIYSFDSLFAATEPFLHNFQHIIFFFSSSDGLKW